MITININRVKAISKLLFFTFHFSLFAYCLIGQAKAQTNEMLVQVNKPGAKIEKTMYGIFFEDINFAADGGLYGEMVKNRSFEFKQNLMGWRTFGETELRNDGPFERNPHYLRLCKPRHKEMRTGLENEGFFGITTEKDATYRLSLWARCPEGGESQLEVQFIEYAAPTGTQHNGRAKINVSGNEWKKYTVEMKADRNVKRGSLRLFLRTVDNAYTTTDVEHISLFPTDTWKGRENGMRRDLAQALYDLRPGVFRFPGGCIVEGITLDNRYQWKNSVGPVENRPINQNRWEYTFDNHYYPDYYQSLGLGFFEYFQLCEDFGAEPLPVLSCGLTCQYQNWDPNTPGAHAPLDQLDEYIQDALDLIEFANGPADSQWGSVRAEMGHPTPFNLHFLGIGNEQWDYDDNPAYTARLKRFLDILRKKHPEIKYIGSTGPQSEGKEFDMLQPRMHELKVDLYDEHYYRPESWFLDHVNRHRYDNYDRKGPKIFAGEYACHGEGKGWNHFNAALCEAAFMTGLERNADIVHMATYAPLFAHVEGWQWRPDMIWFDNQHLFKTCSYYVQQLYSLYKGTHVLPLTMNKRAVAGDADQNGLSASAVINDNTGEVYIKVANISDTPQPLRFTLKGAKGLRTAKVITLHSDNPDAENTIDNPLLVSPQEQSITIADGTIETLIAPKTFAVYVVQ